MKFKVGDRVVSPDFVFQGGRSARLFASGGVITSTHPPMLYEVAWDSGYTDVTNEVWLRSEIIIEEEPI